MEINTAVEQLAALGNAYAGRADAPTLLAGNGKDQVHLLVVATGERGTNVATPASPIRAEPTRNATVSQPPLGYSASRK